MKGINLDNEGKEDTEFDAVRRRVEAKLRGITEEEVELAEIGVAIIDEDEEVD